MCVRVGILKPDHLGDMVLAAPAIAALRRRFADATLFCHPRNTPLAQHLFPGLRTCALHLPHLDKEHGHDHNPAQRLRLLRDQVDLLICLRWDGQCERLLSIPEVEHHRPGPAVTLRHTAAEHRALVRPFTDPYEILDSYVYPGCPQLTQRPAQVSRVGLCLSAGFRLNAWPVAHWLDLALRLSGHGLQPVLLGGPAEQGRLRILADGLAAAGQSRPRIIVGTNDFGATLQEIADAVDLVVATDSGTAHLAALVRPVVSLFGGSPWQRFAPLGRHNLILSRRFPCSPCKQFNRVELNTCHTQGCLTNLSPEQVERCLTAYLAGVDFTQEVQLEGVWISQAPWEESQNLVAVP
jgi:ADP-heptose:LPS heptosyltransferase